MPAASAAYAPSRRRPRPGGTARSGSIRAAGRVRWDRLGRIAMLFVLLALVILYVGAGLHMLSTLHQSHRASARVAAMESEHHRLIAEHNRLSSQANLEEQAKALGMQRPDEQTFILGGLPAN
ncbi:MAG TPA: hypothetical protein VN618_05910 [Solirubrobacteraceae bacterium]|nr:hypothetical protein [Solirubrobacteraceae bacterium]